MKTVVLEVRSLGESLDDAARAMKTGRAERVARIAFASPELLWRVLTTKRWELLKAMCGAGPMSIREAARRVGRDVKAVHGDVKALLDAGVLRRNAAGATSAKQPSPERAVPPSPYFRPRRVATCRLCRRPIFPGCRRTRRGRPIIAASRNYALVVDEDAKLRPVNVLAACSELVTQCVKPSEHTLDACFMSVPQCAWAQPWDDPAYKPCCPAQCWAQYEQKRIAGMAPIAAFRATLYGTGEPRAGGCIPIR